MKNKINRLGIIAFVAVIGFAMVGCASAPRNGAMVSEGGFSGRVGTAGRDTWVIITGGPQGDIQIPSQIRNMPVIAIEERAFYSGGVTSVTIPDSVQFIGNSAFRDNQLTSVTIPGSVQYIGGSAFRDNQLTSVTIPDSVRSISYSAFRNNQLTSDPRPSGASIHTNAFNENPFVEERLRAAALQRAEQEQARQAEQARLAELFRQAGNNFGNLPNTSRTFREGSGRLLYIQRYNFGDGNFILETGHPNYRGNLGGTWTRTGTFRLSGDMVIFRSSEGVYSFGTIIGSTFTIGNRVFR